MKRSFKFMLALMLVGGASLGLSGTNTADARIFPATVTSDCINGQQYSYHTGWFGSGMTETVWDC